MSKILFEKTLKNNKTFRVINGDISKLNEKFDLLICSAFKDDYYPVPGTLIGSLYYNLNIDVEKLSKNPEMEMKNFGCWISNLDSDYFKRICCVELLNLDEVNKNNGYVFENGEFKLDESKYSSKKIVNRTFSTMKFILEQLNFEGVNIENIILPILGSGNQGIEIDYLVGPLVQHCFSILEEIDGVKSISICEYSEEKAYRFVKLINKVLNPNVVKDVFISYSSKNYSEALKVAQILNKNNISYWMAPDSIPTGSSYLDEIASAIVNSSCLVLVLSRDAENSSWVVKEVETAIDCKKKIIPYKYEDYLINLKFNLILRDCQILSFHNQDELVKRLIDSVK